MSGSIPLVDLAAQHRVIADEVREGIDRLFERGDFILGDEVAAFEEEFASFIGASHCIGVGNGTDALELALRAVGVGHGDSVIVPANTFYATATAVARVGAKPELVDADDASLLLDPSMVTPELAQRAKAIIPVHLFGQIAPMEEVVRAVEGHECLVIEDAAQSQGATRDGKAQGTWGVAAGTSFYPGKNLGAYGDAGAVTTSDDDIATKLRLLRNHGSEVKYQHESLGYNSRLDTIQAIVLRAKLRHLEEWNEQRRALAARYDDAIAQMGVDRAVTSTSNVHVFHLYVIRVPERDRVLQELNAAGIGAGMHYPFPLHLQEAFRYLGYSRGDFPVAEKAASEILSLPIFPGMTEAQQDAVVEALRSALK